MTTEALTLIPVPCETPGCTTREGRQHMLPVQVASSYAVVQAKCGFCKVQQTRIIMDGAVVESRYEADR